MLLAVPTIQKFMTCNPICIDASASIDDAQKLMKNNNIRYLPVVLNKEVVAIISDRDVKLVLGCVGGEPEKLKVLDIANSSVYKVSPHDPIDRVTAEMANHHFGSAIVEDKHRLVGIFTTVDALKAISDICHTGNRSLLKPLIGLV